MATFSKFAVLFFVLLASYAGLSTANSGKRVHAIAEELPLTYLSDNNLTFCFFRSTEQLTSFVNNFPPPSSKVRASDGLGGLFFALKVRKSVSDYLFNAREIYPALAACDIIFPFHYFW